MDGGAVDYDSSVASTPIRPDTEPQEIDRETDRIINERLATFDEDVKTASPWAEVEARLMKRLNIQQVR